MVKSIKSYWNALNSDKWQPLEGSNGLIEQLTLSSDANTGDYTRLTRFKPGADTTSLGPSVHEYPEEIFIIKGRLYDAAFRQWLETGDYTSRPPGEVHGPFKSDVECVVLEVSYPSQAISEPDK